MNMKNLIPWGRRNVRVRREGDKSFYSLQRSINQVFDLTSARLAWGVP